MRSSQKLIFSLYSTWYFLKKYLLDNYAKKFKAIADGMACFSIIEINY